MITEDFLSYEVAKILKEKGFNEPCRACYIYEKIFYYDYCSTNFELIGNIISAPTLQMAMKWLREVHNINIDIVSIWNKVRWEYQIIIITPKTAAKPYIHKTIYKKREQACESAIKYCLENLM